MKGGIEAYAWRKEEKSGFLYIFQVTAMPTLLKQASAEIGGKNVGQGYNALTKKSIVLLEREFSTRVEWVAFAKGLSFQIVELSDKREKKRTFNERKR